MREKQKRLREIEEGWSDEKVRKENQENIQVDR